MKKNNKCNIKWIIGTLAIVGIVFGLLVLILWNPLIGLTAMLFALLTLFVSCVLRRYFAANSQSRASFGDTSGDTASDTQDEPQSKTPDFVVGNSTDSASGNAPDSVSASNGLRSRGMVLPLSKAQKANSERLLRYATAVLSFLSLITTANGMRSFVFSTDWMAYIGSFAVQSILVVFSLLLCRFFAQITNLSWPSYVKTLAKEVLVCFFCIALIVSSTFSFTYIANNAYRDVYVNDYETAIYNFLLEQTLALQTENNRRGEKILDEINKTAGEQLLTGIEAVQAEKNEQLKQDLVNLIQSVNMQEMDETAAVESVEIDKDEWLQAFPRYQREIELLFADYNDNYKQQFEKGVDAYNDALREIKSWQSGGADFSNIKTGSADIALVLNKIIYTLGLRISGIDNWKTSGQQLDNSVYRSTYQQECDSLKNSCDTLLKKVNEINQKATEIEQNEAGGAQDELDDILSDIYLLGTDDSIQTEDIIAKINDLAIQGSGNDIFDNETIKNLVELKENLLLSADFLQQKADLANFLDENLKAVEEIDAEDETAKSEWIDKRKTDFNTFRTLINDLQETEEYAFYRAAESGGEATEPDGEASGSISISEKVWDANAVSEKAMKMQRDLLGELTDFERAFNYFSYGYPMMAFFSAFVAVFFDLGAFLTGCFLYMAEFFEVKGEVKKNEGKENENLRG